MVLLLALMSRGTVLHPSLLHALDVALAVGGASEVLER